MDKRQPASEIEDEAARWVVRLDREGRTAQMQADLDAWLAGDARRSGAFLKAEAAWSLLDRRELLSPPEHIGNLDRPQRGRGVRTGVVGAIAAALAAVSLYWGWTWLGADRVHVEHYASRPGEIRQVTFADGSTATLNSRTRVDVAYRARLRAVTVAQGEAWFDVAKDPSRPFVVSAGTANVKAVGTAFAVRHGAGMVDVRVTEGVVEVWAGGAQASRVLVTAGAMVQVAQNRVSPPRQRGLDELDRELQWRAGKIDLAGQTLAQAVEQFNRHVDRKLVIADPRLSGEQLHGIFRLNDAEGFANAVQASLEVPVDFSQADRILIGAPPAQETGP